MSGDYQSCLLIQKGRKSICRFCTVELLRNKQKRTQCQYTWEQRYGSTMNQRVPGNVETQRIVLRKVHIDQCRIRSTETQTPHWKWWHLNRHTNTDSPVERNVGSSVCV